MQRIMKVRGPLSAVSLVVVTRGAEWEVGVHGRHRAPAGRDTLPWQRLDHFRVVGGKSPDNLDAVMEALCDAALNRRLPGIG